jgi:hypothetical protein
MVEKQPREVYFLCVLFIAVSNIIWTMRIALELKAVFCSVLFIMVLAFAFVFIELGKVKNL